MKQVRIITGLFILVSIIILTGVYTVDETEQVVITQFGRAIGQPVKSPGIKWKMPVIQQVNRFPKNLLQWDGDPGQVPTKDKTYLWVDSFARWKIVDPLKFFQTVNNVTAAQARLDDIIDPAVRNFITSYPLIETVRMTNRSMGIFESEMDQEEGGDVEKKVRGEVFTGREVITKDILKQAAPKLTKFGIELIDVAIKRLNYVEEVRDSVYNRMIAERRQIAEKYRSEGEGEARKIEGSGEKDLKKIQSEAYRTAQEIKGKADAEAALIYADAYNRDPDFFSFVKSLDVYKSTLDANTSLVLSTDSDFLGFLKRYDGENKGR